MKCDFHKFVQKSYEFHAMVDMNILDIYYLRCILRNRKIFHKKIISNCALNVKTVFK